MAGPDINKFTLLIWEEIPEDTKLYLVPNEEIDDRLRAVLNCANGQIINTTTSSNGAQVLNHMLTSKFPPDEEAIEHMADWDPSWLGRFEKFHFEPMKDPTLAGGSGLCITHIYHCGFMM
jgi:hypothetical protein